MGKVTFVSPYRDLTLMVQAVAEDMNAKIAIVEGVYGEQGWVGENPFERYPDAAHSDVFISRGGTASFLARDLDGPVISLDTSAFDILECCKQAKVHSRNIVITSFKPLAGLSLIEEVLDITITEFLIPNHMPEYEKQIANLAADGHYCVIGGGMTIFYANKYGVPSVFLHVSRDSIHEAILRAQELAALHAAEKRNTTRLKTILDSANEGIIVVDEKGKIEIYNQAAEKILGIHSQEALSHNIEDVIPTTRLQEVLLDGRTHISEFQDVGDVQIVTSRVPIQYAGKNVGAVATFQAAKQIAQIEHRMRKEATAQKFSSRRTFNDILGHSPLLNKKKELARKYAASDLTVFIYGASGTGKELFAQGIHHASRRSKGPFVAVNCGALPPTLLESELFGYAEGAFTGAKRKGKMGLFELAHQGTIFLDEIDAMSIDMQGRLLRVLQEREVLRIGADGIIPVDIRVISASNKPPKKLLEDKLIREDLFYRLNVLYLEIPPLSMRKEDIPWLCLEFLPEKLRARAQPLVDDMLPFLLQYAWPGNVRELLNFSQRLSFFLEDYWHGDNGVDLLREMAPDFMQTSDVQAADHDLRSQIAFQEETLIVKVLDQSTTLAEAAAQLGIPKTTLWRKIQKIKDHRS